MTDTPALINPRTLSSRKLERAIPHDMLTILVLFGSVATSAMIASIASETSSKLALYTVPSASKPPILILLSTQ